MKKSKFTFPIFFLLLSILFGCAQKIKDADVETDIAAIRGIYDNYFLAANKNDLDLFMSVWTEDAIRMEHRSRSIVGRENIRVLFKGFFDNLNIKIGSYGEIEVEISGDLAYSRGNYILSTSPKEGGPTNHLDAKWLDILKRQTDGSWKIYIDCPNDNPLWSPDSISPEMLEKQDLSDPRL